MSTAHHIPLSILDLAPITQGGSAAEAFYHSKDLAQHAEKWGYHRYWLAEHHNMTGIASAATSVLIGYIAQHTNTIRVGAGGIMLPNHSPLVIAEQFGTLASLYPNRIDLGLGRAPGTDQVTIRALRRTLHQGVDSFPDDVRELQRYFDEPDTERYVTAVPGQGLHVPLWLLGSSLYSAQLAAKMGLPFSFASHFAPDMMQQALSIYRQNFCPSAALKQPYTMVCVNVIAGDSDAHADRLFTSQMQQFIQLLRGSPGQLPAPVDDITTVSAPHEQISAERTLRLSIVGGVDKVRAGLQHLVQETQADEVMVNGQIFDHTARLRSFEIISSLQGELTGS